MVYGLEGPENPEDAESLLSRARLADSDSEVQALLIETETALKELLSTSYPNQPNPGVYKVTVALHPQTLNAALSILNDKATPKLVKSKFTFKNIKKKPTAPPVSTPSEPDLKVEEAPKTPEFTYSDNCVIKNLAGKRFSETSKIGSVTLDNIDNCEVVLLNVAESAFFYNVKGCIIWLSIANSSVLLDTITDSTIVTCSRQLRISNSRNVKFFVNTVTPPIIEMSSGLMFSLNHLFYTGFDQHLKNSDLKAEFLKTQDLVRDFSWHHPDKSPNWEALEPKPRHTATVIELDQPDDLNSQSLSESDWRLLRAL